MIALSVVSSLISNAVWQNVTRTVTTAALTSRGSPITKAARRPTRVTSLGIPLLQPWQQPRRRGRTVETSRHEDPPSHAARMDNPTMLAANVSNQRSTGRGRVLHGDDGDVPLVV